MSPKRSLAEIPAEASDKWTVDDFRFSSGTAMSIGTISDLEVIANPDTERSYWSCISRAEILDASEVEEFRKRKLIPGVRTAKSVTFPLITFCLLKEKISFMESI